ncbi:MAG: UPF0175 family protein [Caldilineaceae bacterium]|nr:UPF0175 family protein [Caldilineaceae bacterium]
MSDRLLAYDWAHVGNWNACYNATMSDTVQLTLELPRQLFSAFRQEPEEFLAAMRLAAAVKWYETEQLSQAKAAEIAGLSRAEFLAALDRFGVTPFRITASDLIHEAQSSYDT